MYTFEQFHGIIFVYMKNLNGHYIYMYYLWNKIEQLQPSPNHGMGKKCAFKRMQFRGIF